MTILSQASPPQLIASLPGLATALRVGQASTFRLPNLHALRQQELVSMYRIDSSSLATESAAAMQTVAELMERLRRLAEAYGEWREFDCDAYFDLTSAQTASLLYLRERVSTVHVRFAVDALLPSFQQALRFWDGQYAPTAARLRQAILSGHPADAPNAEQQHAIQTIMIQHWAKAQAVVTNVRDVLADDIGYLSMRGAGEEQARWQRRWSEANPPDLLHTITPALGQIPSLTLVFDFPLPPSRQPGRMRRMRRHRARRRHNHSR